MSIKKEHIWRISAAAAVGALMTGSTDREAIQSPSRAAINIQNNTTTEIISEENFQQNLPPYMRQGYRTPTPYPGINKDFATPSVVYTSPVDEENEIIENENFEKIFIPNHKLDLEKMRLTELEKQNIVLWQDLIQKQAKYYDWDANLAAAMMIIESGGVNGLVNELGAAGLWGILANHNGSPDVDTLMNPFTNGTWHFAKMVDLCKRQRRGLEDSILMYGGWSEKTPAAIDYLHDILTTAGYMDEEGNKLIPDKCESIENVPEPPLQSDLQVDLH